jgi:alpha 1,6-mannosyltransferase
MHYGRVVLGFAIFFSVAYFTFYSTGTSFLAPDKSFSPTHIPRKIWQTSKQPSMALEEEYRANIKKWQEMSPEWRYELLTDAGSEEYVRDTFGEGSEITEVYTSLKDNILRADLFRYLALYGSGGAYSDVDCEPLRSIESFVPQEYKTRTRAVVGLEYDTMLGQYSRGQALLDLQLCNWYFMSAKRHRLLALVVENVLSSLKELAQKQAVALPDVKATFNDVLSCTGPVQFTRSTWQYLTEVTGKDFTWEMVSTISEPLLVHDVLIMPVTAFGNGQSHSGSKPPSDPDALVHHQFKGSWKTGSHAYKAMEKAEGA